MKIMILILIYNIFTINLFSQGYTSVKNSLVFSRNRKEKIFTYKKNYLYDYHIKYNNLSGKIHINPYNSNEWYIGKKEENKLTQKIDFIKLKLVKRNIFNRINFFQSQISYEYITSPLLSILEETSLIDNKKNIWIHPPRSNFFEILQLAPFPYIQFPIKIGNSWEDKIIISDFWSNNWLAKWKGNLELKLKYIVKEKVSLNLSQGEVDAYLIEAISNSILGETVLYIYFNREQGIIKYSYNILNKCNIDFMLINETGK